MKIQNLQYSKKRTTIIRNLSLEIDVPFIVGIDGHNGCGKSTLLSLLFGNLKPDSGVILLNCSSVGYAPQISGLIPECTVWDHLCLYSLNKLNGIRKKDRLRSFNKLKSSLILPLFDIDSILFKKCGKLSAGSLQKVNLTCAALSQPDLLILDEPETALDTESIEVLNDFINSFYNCGKSIIMVSHDKSQLSLCTHLYQMNNGQLKSVSI